MSSHSLPAAAATRCPVADGAALIVDRVREVLTEVDGVGSVEVTVDARAEWWPGMMAARTGVAAVVRRRDPGAMSGNLCRCAVCNGMVDAIHEVADGQV